MCEHGARLVEAVKKLLLYFKLKIALISATALLSSSALAIHYIQILYSGKTLELSACSHPHI